MAAISLKYTLKICECELYIGNFFFIKLVDWGLKMSNARRKRFFSLHFIRLCREW
jgi:hypothetical protein